MRTFGVEEEYGLVDPRTRELVPASAGVMARAEHAMGDAVQSEFKSSQIEMATPVCATLDDVEREVRAARRRLGTSARAEGARLIAAGTHPFSAAAKQRTTDKERYRGLSDTYREIARELVIFGCHVHVGIDDPELCIAIFDRVRWQLVPLLALAANSPFWNGHDTGYASYRTEVWSRWPLAGPPDAFGSRATYDRLVRDLVESDCIGDETNLYWDLRPSARFPTLEFRVTDVCATVDEAVAIAGLVRALVETCARDIASGVAAPAVRTERIRVAHWRAARDGLDGELIDLGTNRRAPAGDIVREFLTRQEPALSDAGDLERVRTTVERILRDGNGASRQRRAFATGGSEAVVDALIAETEA